MSLDAIITAGGSGLRFGLKKQFIELKGVPVLKRSVAPFLEHESVDHVIVVVPVEDKPLAQEMFSYAGTKITVIEGGRTRQESVYKGLIAAREADFVLIHDGVRPFPSHGLITRVIEGLAGADGCIPALTVTDTLKEAKGGFIERTLSRHDLYQVQTPQAFRTREILQAHEKAMAEGRTEVTDDSGLMESMGMTVRMVSGEAFNVKITFESDLLLAEAITLCLTAQG
jgi:2-C-methyl-D-erythritol 4-phosphate cytidylyltransferase